MVVSQWKSCGGGWDADTGLAIYHVTKGSKSLNAGDHDELEALLRDAQAIRESLANLVGLAKLGAAPIHQYEAAIKHAEQVLSK